MRGCVSMFFFIQMRTAKKIYNNIANDTAADCIDLWICFFVLYNSSSILTILFELVLLQFQFWFRHWWIIHCFNCFMLSMLNKLFCQFWVKGKYGFFNKIYPSFIICCHFQEQLCEKRIWKSLVYSYNSFYFNFRWFCLPMEWMFISDGSNQVECFR